jgi:hypothetical protein
MKQPFSEMLFEEVGIMGITKSISWREFVMFKTFQMRLLL